jgi:hypothetical protein
MRTTFRPRLSVALSIGTGAGRAPRRHVANERDGADGGRTPTTYDIYDLLADAT